MRRMRDLRRFFQDPSKGLEYNLISMTRRVSSGVYLVDIARSPMIARNDLVSANVLDEARHVNAERELLNKRASRFKGRS